MNLRQLSLAAALALAPLMASAQSPQLKSVLDQMNAASARFKNVQADVKYDNYTRVVNDHDFSTGSMYVERSGGTQRMGAVAYNVGADGKASAQPYNIINFDGKTLRVYNPNPGENQVQIFDAGANKAKYDSFLNLGFGGSGQDLAQSWNITDQGSETIDGVKTEKLDLVSKDPSVNNTFTHVTIWIDPARAVSLKQTFYAPNGDNRTATYSNIRLNGRINDKPYNIPTKGVSVVHR